MSEQMISEQISLEEAKRNSPLLHLPKHGCPLIISYGASETSEFKRQSELLADAWKSKGWEVDIFEHPVYMVCMYWHVWACFLHYCRMISYGNPSENGA